MAGNVWEWCEDRSSEDKESRVLPGELRAAGRFSYGPADTNGGGGFRCVSGL